MWPEPEGSELRNLARVGPLLPRLSTRRHRRPRQSPARPSQVAHESRLARPILPRTTRSRHPSTSRLPNLKRQRERPRLAVSRHRSLLSRTITRCASGSVGMRGSARLDRAEGPACLEPPREDAPRMRVRRAGEGGTGPPEDQRRRGSAGGQRRRSLERRRERVAQGSSALELY